MLRRHLPPRMLLRRTRSPMLPIAVATPRMPTLIIKVLYIAQLAVVLLLVMETRLVNLLIRPSTKRGCARRTSWARIALLAVAVRSPMAMVNFANTPHLPLPNSSRPHLPSSRSRSRSKRHPHRRTTNFITSTLVRARPRPSTLVRKPLGEVPRQAAVRRTVFCRPLVESTPEIPYQVHL